MTIPLNTGAITALAAAAHNVSILTICCPPEMIEQIGAPSEMRSALSLWAKPAHLALSERDEAIAIFSKVCRCLKSLPRHRLPAKPIFVAIVHPDGTFSSLLIGFRTYSGSSGKRALADIVRNGLPLAA